MQAWLQKHGPYNAVLDGANIAFFGQNWEEGGFQFSQIGAAVETLMAEQPDVKPLVVSTPVASWESCRVQSRRSWIMAKVGKWRLPSSRVTEPGLF